MERIEIRTIAQWIDDIGGLQACVPSISRDKDPNGGAIAKISLGSSLLR
jgi:hypothetical protein